MRWLLEQIKGNNKAYLDLERLDLRRVFQDANYENILVYFQSLGLRLDQPLTIALDEIQNVSNLPGVVKYLYDHHHIKFLLTGSSSYYLKNQFSQSMAGRKVVYEMYPLGFGEFLDFRGVPYRRHTSFNEMTFNIAEYQRLKAYYEDFVSFGGMSAVVLETDPRKKLKSSRISMRPASISMFRHWPISAKWMNCSNC